MKGSEFLRRIRTWAKKRGIRVDVRAQGKGSHQTLYVGDRKTTMKDPKKEIGRGLLGKMLKDLDIDKSEL